MSQLSGAPVWVKSSRCDAGQCVEVSWQGERIAVRDNTRPDIHLGFDRTSWLGLVQRLRHGHLDR
jgi:hypothetical protein